MSEITQEDYNAALQQIEIDKLYIGKNEVLLQETIRRMIAAEIRGDVLQNQANDLTETVRNQNDFINKAREALDATARERNNLKDQLQVHNASDMEVTQYKSEREAAIRKRDDYHRELQLHIGKCNDLEKKVQELTADNQSMRQQLNAYEETSKIPSRKVARIKA